MKREELAKAVIEALRQTQQLSGHGADVIITEATEPIGDLPEFDSHNAVEATVALEERLGQSLPVNLFADDAGGRPLSVRDVVDRLLGLAPTTES